MTHAQRSGLNATLRAQLASRLEQLEKRAGRIERDLRAPQQRDSEEQAVELENEEVLTRLDETTLNEISKLRGALARLDAGTYGRCTRCNREIDKRRLEALPDAELCIACAS